MQTELFVELKGKQIDTAPFIDHIKEFWKSEGKLVKDLKLVRIYFKPEESTCYYVINNGEVEGSFQV